MKRQICLAAAAALTLVACGGSDDAAGNPPNDPAATFGTLPADDTAPAVSSTSAPTTPSSTAPLVPGGDNDLPTAGPDELAAGPSTTVLTGPLPIPSVELVPVAEFDTPVELTTRPGDVRSFIVEQGGRVVAFDDLSTEVVLDITGLTSASGEQGLLGAAFDPDADLAYVHYNDSDGNTVLDEYAIDPVTAIFDLASRREVLTVEQPFGNHNGGELAFGPDGYLYLGLGDGGAANDPERNSLVLSSRLGKILRIDPQETADGPFAVPSDNPFVGIDGADPTIWSLGLRNPWKFSFDTATGDLWIADVGQGDIEEINFAPAINGGAAGKGLSFGWSAFEGSARFNTDQGAEGHTLPIVEYPHEEGNCSVSGGAVARNSAVADLTGWFVFGDFCSGRIWGYDTTSPPGAPIVVELGELPNVASIAVGAEGDLFAVSIVGTVARFTPA